MLENGEAQLRRTPPEAARMEQPAVLREFREQLRADGGDPDVVEVFEDGFAIGRQSVTLTAEEQFVGETERSRVGVEPSVPWAPGRYWVYVYEDGRKVAQVEYEITP